MMMLMTTRIMTTGAKRTGAKHGVSATCHSQRFTCILTSVLGEHSKGRALLLLGPFYG